MLQHPLEVGNAKNTLDLLKLSLSNTRISVGEQFNPNELQALLYQDQRQPLLLYPETSEDAAMGLVSPVPLPDLNSLNVNHLRLVVLDGTWRKSRKMLYLNPLLQGLPRLSLASVPKSMSLIRKAHNENQLSTLEASCYALQQLEQNARDYSPLLSAFANFVAQQAAFAPKTGLTVNHSHPLKST